MVDVCEPAPGARSGLSGSKAQIRSSLANVSVYSCATGKCCVSVEQHIPSRKNAKAHGSDSRWSSPHVGRLARSGEGGPNH